MPHGRNKLHLRRVQGKVLREGQAGLEKAALAAYRSQAGAVLLMNVNPLDGVGRAAQQQHR